jgi:hypothetical protein
MSKKHKVRTHHWYSGLLHTKDQEFDSLLEAMGYANSVEAHSIKVYDENDQIVHQVNPTVNINTYA